MVAAEVLRRQRLHWLRGCWGLAKSATVRRWGGTNRTSVADCVLQGCKRNWTNSRSWLMFFAFVCSSMTTTQFLKTKIVQKEGILTLQTETRLFIWLILLSIHSCNTICSLAGWCMFYFCSFPGMLGCFCGFLAKISNALHRLHLPRVSIPSTFLLLLFSLHFQRFHLLVTDHTHHSDLRRSLGHSCAPAWSLVCSETREESRRSGEAASASKLDLRVLTIFATSMHFPSTLTCTYNNYIYITGIFGIDWYFQLRVHVLYKYWQKCFVSLDSDPLSRSSNCITFLISSITDFIEVNFPLFWVH